MKERKLDILGLGEVKWKKQGEKKCREGYRLFWSGNARFGVNGVAVMVNKRVSNLIEEVQYISDRIIVMSIKNRNKIIKIIQVYAPQSGCADEEKADFETELEDLITRSRTNLIMGDFNAQVGRIRTGFEEVLGAFGFGGRNEEGANLLDLCQRNGFRIGNSFFKKQESHTVTRYSWDGKLKSVIDYILVDKMWEHRLLNVKVIPSVHLGSDHRLLVANVLTRIEPPGRVEGVKRIKVWKLNDKGNQEQYKQQIATRLPKDEIGSEEGEWSLFKTTLVETAERICGRTSGKVRNRKTNWWNDKTKEAVRNKNRAFRQYWKSLTNNYTNANFLREEYTRQKRICRRVIKEEKDKSWEDFTVKMKKDMSGNKKMFYNMMRNKRRVTESAGKMEALDGGIVLDEPEEIKRLWFSYFKDLLNAGCNSEDIAQDQSDEEINVDDITLKEVEDAIKIMRNNKAAGPDEVTMDLIKAAGPVGVHWLYRVLRSVWKSKRMPDEWGHGEIITLFKKGNRKQCKNYRGITLMSQCAKLFERIVLNRIKAGIEGQLSEEQHGFRPGRSTIDLVFAIRQLVERKWEFGKRLIMVFIDIEKAYDSVLRESVWKSLRTIGIESSYINLIKEMYRVHKCRVRTNFGNTEWFEVKRGLKQGSVLSPCLFNVVMECITREVKKKFHGDTKSMIFADDLMIWGEEVNEVQGRLDEWNRQMKKHGLKISTGKSEVLVIGRNEEARVDITLDGSALKQVDNFTYLGTVIGRDASIEHEISNRLNKGGRFYQNIKHLVWDRKIPQKAKMIMFKTYYLPILLYGAETWTMSEKQWSRVTAGEMKFLRAILGKTRMDRVRNTEVREELKIKSVRRRIEDNRIRWLGHVKRMDDLRIPKVMSSGREEGKRPRGRPRRRWMDEVIGSVEARGFAWHEVVQQELWRDRVKWRGLVNS